MKQNSVQNLELLRLSFLKCVQTAATRLTSEIKEAGSLNPITSVNREKTWNIGLIHF